MKTFVLSIVGMIALSSLKAQVVLNEVYTDPGSAKHEFFELYNTSTSMVPENLNNYTLIAYYEESGVSGFYVLDMPDMSITARNFFVAASSLSFNVQGQNNLTANFSWDFLPSGGALSKWESTGSSYSLKTIPVGLNDIFIKKSGSGAGYHFFVFKNGVLINGLIGGGSSNSIPSYIKSMPSLAVDMIAPSTDFTVNFSNISDNQVEYVIPVPGSDNGYIRQSDGKCGVWQKSSSSVNHTPGVTNGSAIGQTGELTLTSYIKNSFLYYHITAGSADVFPATMEAYRDFGILGQLDASDILFDSRQIVSAGVGLQQIGLVNYNDQVILLAKSPAGCYDKVIFVANGILPVKLVSFTAMLNNNKVDLKWTTATEINVSHFTVERSMDGTHFSDAGMVFAYGNTTTNSDYALSDNISNLQSGIIYYRLRSVDVDGKSEYSDTRIIRISKQGENVITIITFPNPVTNELKITIPANWQNKKIMYEVFNSNGQVSKKSEAAKSSQTETLNVSNLNSGLYIIKVTCEGQTVQQKIIKQ